VLASLFQLAVAYHYKTGTDLGELAADDELIGPMLAYDMISQFNGPPSANLDLDSAKDMAKEALSDILPEYQLDIHRL
jgi:hypothetical protein